MFLDNEIITDDSGGSAKANGTLSHQNCALLGSTVVIRTGRDHGGLCRRLCRGNRQHRVQVTGDTGDTLEWIRSAAVVN